MRVRGVRGVVKMINRYLEHVDLLYNEIERENPDLLYEFDPNLWDEDEHDAYVEGYVDGAVWALAWLRDKLTEVRAHA